MPPNHKSPENGDEEEDYMSMIIQEPATQQRETLTQRKLRKQREVRLFFSLTPHIQGTLKLLKLLSI